MMKKITLIVGVVLAIAAVVGGFLMTRGSDNVDSRSASSVEQDVRQLVYISDDEDLVNSLLINSDEALENLRAESDNHILDEAKPGDYYLAFEKRGVLYRPSENKVVYIVPIHTPQAE